MQILKAIAIFFVVFNLVPLALLADRKVLGRFQHRYGPNRVGPFGLLQAIADIGKLVFKAQFRPADANGWLFAVAPVISMMTAAATIAIIPFSDVVDIFGTKTGLYGVDPSIGILFAFAFGGISFYGLMLGGWASGSKYSLPRLDARRGAADLLRGRPGPLARRRDDDGRLALADRHRQVAGGRTSGWSARSSSAS